jgi:hypothetical protein
MPWQVKEECTLKQDHKQVNSLTMVRSSISSGQTRHDDVCGTTKYRRAASCILATGFEPQMPNQQQPHGQPQLRARHPSAQQQQQGIGVVLIEGRPQTKSIST